MAVPQAAVPGRAGRRPRAARAAGGRPSAAGVDVDAALAWVEQKMGLELAADAARRHRARRRRDKVLVVTGGPGVGKTTIVRGILEIFAASGLRCGLCAPTGRAAKRLDAKRPAARRRRSTACWSSTRRSAASSATRDQPARPRPARRRRGVDGGRGR